MDTIFRWIAKIKLKFSSKDSDPIKMSINPEIEISMEDVRLIMGEKVRQLPKIINSSFCLQCRGPVSSMTVNKIWLNHLGDIIFEGRCNTCSSPVNRYVEVGENPDSYDQAMAIRELKIEVLRDYNPRF